MARCTAPSRGHYTSSGRAACPACGGGSGYGGGYGGYSSSPSYTSNYYPTYSSPAASGVSRTTSGGSNRTARPRWSKSNASGYNVGYTSAEIVALTPVREAVEKIPAQPARRDYFLCHAWDDRATSAKKLHDGIEAAGASVWFSEKDIGLGTSLMREIDRGLANSRVGLVLVTPQLLRRLPAMGVADKELSALLAGNRLVPVLHGTSYAELREVSPLLASRTGLDTAENTWEEIYAKLAELVAGLEPTSRATM